MSEEFQSKFVLPKKLPPYLPEYIGYMEIRKAIDCNMSQQFIGALSATWPDYSLTTRVRKQREKKNVDAPPSTTPSQAQGLSTAEGPVKRLRDYIENNVEDREVRHELLVIVQELLCCL